MSRSPDSTFGDTDAYLLGEGTHARLHEHLGGRLVADGLGATFAVWAPNARSVSVIGDWNAWDPRADPLIVRADSTGVWEGRSAHARHGQAYKFRIVAEGGRVLEKADPLALLSEAPPATASRLWSLAHDWGDDHWMRTRAERNRLDAPISIYEVHPGSWRRPDGALPNYRELARPLAEHVVSLGFTHVELMPVTEHPFYGSWGYQTTGYFAPTARYGTPQDFMDFVDHLHQRGIGVVLDWVPSHFPDDAHGLSVFDGTHLYEHADPRQGFHPEWHSAIFNYGRNEVRSFLVSSALFWLDRYHIDGLRVDAVASMLYLDYARKEGEWIPNRHGGRENLEAITFLNELNRAVYREHPDTFTVAEESTAWPRVSRPIEMGGLGFGMKWNMGWMHDTLAFMKEDPVHRRFHHHRLTFSMVYAFSENFVLPLSHDEVVYGKGSLIGKMPGDAWQQFANLRLLYGYMWAHPGKKLLFMGGEFAQRREWTHEGQLEWQQAELPAHRGVQHLVGELNRLYRSERALHELDASPDGFEWIEADDQSQSVIAFLRRARNGEAVLVVCNLTPVPRRNYRLGVPSGGIWRELLNSDTLAFGGAGWGNLGEVEAAPVPSHGHRQALSLTLPPLSTLYLKAVADA
ncbi:1,4-alpha-glucan branching protein GlgB [Variovorax ginsengisoli]|uniref:1,4-alpha-glucan branching enzyme GlgB n=1 Tax=Variovorax ginsengisoli TaxID=363844 RepID=A0ABT8S1E2_9BURK|nr:1,4-alpha-glucan branching protein GlgB [Variovorax ginsengisoli]MDN8613579.1 1,4-alpha-glucan branching protein GlgB [Variovorax ginsengisoli]MDO1532749.1 1,4-alpha-glucan branching protein GlgB [Variovorax ginsengisoli]